MLIDECEDRKHSTKNYTADLNVVVCGGDKNALENEKCSDSTAEGGKSHSDNLVDQREDHTAEECQDTAEYVLGRIVVEECKAAELAHQHTVCNSGTEEEAVCRTENEDHEVECKCTKYNGDQGTDNSDCYVIIKDVGDNRIEARLKVRSNVPVANEAECKRTACEGKHLEESITLKCDKGKQTYKCEQNKNLVLVIVP